MTQELSNDDLGRFLISTATGSQYVLDLTGRTMERHGSVNAPIPEFQVVELTQLRRDGDVLDLLMVVSCIVGESAQFWIQIREDHVPTLRTTSPVVSIEALPPVTSED
ncbi:hypothetical protein LN996_02625 [Arthrobacter sp. AK01]|uniref:hypothetical protein n=1 Tax=Arthrobacter sp. AK01 TaxID=2894084 RepID=UPI001E4C8AA1|nr:hypothetical protein [Arthrobacter sp. AK01]MCD4849701.1 hypothetical protein [Arthrobacter sp. AK01]